MGIFRAHLAAIACKGLRNQKNCPMRPLCVINHIHNSIGGIGTEMPDYCAIATLFLTHCMNPTV